MTRLFNFDWEQEARDDAIDEGRFLDNERRRAELGDDYEPGYCPACSGSGEGQYDGSTCGTCNGEGEC